MAKSVVQYLYDTVDEMISRRREKDYDGFIVYASYNLDQYLDSDYDVKELKTLRMAIKSIQGVRDINRYPGNGLHLYVEKIGHG